MVKVTAMGTDGLFFSCDYYGCTWDDHVWKIKRVGFPFDHETEYADVLKIVREHEEMHRHECRVREIAKGVFAEEKKREDAKNVGGIKP